MKVLAVNCGSSTLKFQLFDIQADLAPGQERRLAHGIVDRIGGEATIDFTPGDGEHYHETTIVADHGGAIQRILDWLAATAHIGPEGLDAVGHRVVHGGDRFVEPTLINDQVLDVLEALTELAPLHNVPALSTIRAIRSALGPRVPMVATFDTAFHRTMPERASRYAIPHDLVSKHHIQRFGFHGLAHRYMTERYATSTGRPIEQVKLITLQLGNGCSATAVESGRSVDTSMGFTPLEGLVMGTRSGDVDPSLAGYIARQEGVDAEVVEDWLNKRSGLLGISGRSADMRQLLDAERQGDARAALAVDMFCYRARKYIGAYLAVLGGAEAVLFGGGIGENAPAVRERICAGMDWCGLSIDPDRNARIIGSEGRISTDNATVHAYVIPVDEEIVIVRDTIHCLSRQ